MGEAKQLSSSKIHGLKYYKICLSFSLSLNLSFLFYFIAGGGQVPELTWTKRAALEAEAAASISCSRHGRAFVDGKLSSRGTKKPICECYSSCYGGSDCSQFSPQCPADVNSGDPLFLEPFWTQQATQSAVMAAGWHRMSYSMPNGSSMSSELEWHIRRLHTIIGNAVTEGKFIVFGTGSTQLLNAAVHALSLNRSSSSTPASVVASAPYYSGYEGQTTFFESANYEWRGDSNQWINASNPSMDFIEFVTSPNNPDGRLQRAVLGGRPFVKTIHDHAYYWPHYTAIPAPVDEDIMLFTISKLTGHAGSRFGWALIKDESMYEKISTYVARNTMGVSHDIQLRALKLIEVVLQGGGRETFEYGYRVMSDRWMKLSKALSSSKRISLQKLPPRYCTYFRKVTGPSPAYAWLKCEMEEDEDCEAILRAGGIIGRSGTKFGVESRFVRLSLLKSEDDFNLLLHKISTFFSAEISAASI